MLLLFLYCFCYTFTRGGAIWRITNNRILKELQRNFTKNLSRFLDNFIQYSGRNIWGKELMGGYISGLEKKYEELTTPKEAVARLMQIKNDLSHLLEC